MPTASHRSNHVDCLDGLRGIAALWVVIGHAMKLSGWGFRPFSDPDLAVDLFIVLSGFLMAFHYIRREDREPWPAKSTWAVFWLRRFFRIAPLYYVALAAALILGPHLGAVRGFIAEAIPGTGTNPARYFDTSADNILLHVSFLFGFFPDYGYRTAIPDWSIGLEMQFYLAFPFLMLLWRAAGIIPASIAVVVGCLLLKLAMPDFFDAFRMPTFLPTKLPLFLAGMLAAASLNLRGRHFVLIVAAAAAMAFVPTWHDDGRFHLLARIAFVLALVMLPGSARFAGVPVLDRALAAANAILRLRAFRFLGDVSYGVYLLHLLVMIPAAGAAVALFGAGMGGFALFASVLAGTALITYPLAWVLYRTVELPGIQVGRTVIAGALRLRAATAGQ